MTRGVTGVTGIIGARPVFWQPSIAAAAKRGLCTDCGVSRATNKHIDPHDCGRVCQFIAPNYPALEKSVQGKSRDTEKPDELFFGPYQAMHQARLKVASEGAQWTGITTRIAERLLETNRVDAVLTMAPDPNDSWRPVPVLVSKANELRHCRGMRMGYAPLLSLLEPAIDAGFKRLAVIGIPCQIVALRGLEKNLKEQGKLDELLVIGTPCSDNTTTENFHEFLELIGTDIDRKPGEINYLEFKANYHVELRFTDGNRKEIPFLKLPLSKLRPDFFPLTCRTCVDYTNVLSDITVGYMAGSGEQWLIVRNDKGQSLVEMLGDELVREAPKTGGKRAGPVKGFLKNVQLAAGGLPVQSMPNWLRPIVAWLMPKVGPKGLEFARARVEMKALETIIHLRREHPKKMKNMVPSHVWALAKPYGLTPTSEEQLISRTATGNIENATGGE
jgi:coenzyme F420 hydrogenase subunit beta